MLIKIFTASFIILFASCNTSKDTSKQVKNDAMNNEAELNTMKNKMINDGFHLGEIKHLKESECSYIIIDQETEAKFDPINITDALYKAIRNDGEKVYYKYRPLRRMNRCTEANPIEIIDIKKREG
jgi:PBP1b-binding outer membrane lipoprotein LpoB